MEWTCSLLFYGAILHHGFLTLMTYEDFSFSTTIVSVCLVARPDVLYIVMDYFFLAEIR